MNEKEYAQNLVNTAKNTLDRVKKELIVLEQNYDSLKDKNTFVLPLVVHNICIIFERQAYKFIEPLQSMFSFDTNLLNDNDKAKVSAIQKILTDLSCREYKAYNEQLQNLPNIEKKAKENNSEFDRETEINYFEHVEYDFGDMFREFFMILFTSQYNMTAKQINATQKALSIAHSIFETEIPKKKLAIENCNKIINGVQC